MKVTIATAIALASLALSACSQQVQNEPQVQTPKPKVIYKVKKVYVDKGKHMHVIKGYGWHKKIWHSHPAPHKHRKPAVKRVKPKYRAKVRKYNPGRTCRVCCTTTRCR